MNKRIKIYSIILGIVYIVAIGFSMSDVIMGMMIGVKHGLEIKNNKTSSGIEVLGVNVVPEDYSFSDMKTNLKTGESVSVISRGYLVMMELPQEGISVGRIILKVVGIFFTLLLLGVMVYMPFLFFSILKSITKDKIIDNQVIRRISKIGWLLVGTFVIRFLMFNLASTLYARSILQLENYKIVIDFSNGTFLILGIVTLLLSEILKFSLTLKEEQDLTI